MHVTVAGSGRQDRRDIPALRARAGGPAERLAARVGGRHPAAAFFAALVCGFVVLAGLSLLLGLLVTDVLLPADGVSRADESIVESIVADRTPLLTEASAAGSAAGGSPVLPILVAVVALASAALRRWRIAGFAAFVLLVESATYRVTSGLLPRHRPEVQRLDHLPVNASYPSGHTAASVAVYAGFVLLLTSGIRSRAVRIAAWVVAVVVPLFVATSRVYRGMHHPIDVAGGALVGAGAIAVMLFACRAAEAAARAPASGRSPVTPHGRRQVAS